MAALQLVLLPPNKPRPCFPSFGTHAPLLTQERNCVDPRPHVPERCDWRGQSPGRVLVCLCTCVRPAVHPIRTLRGYQARTFRVQR